jgi:hypothetical protein
LLREEGISAEVLEVNVREPSMEQELGFLGSPTVSINSQDLLAPSFRVSASVIKQFGR